VKTKRKVPNPIDEFVGKRVRLQRVLMGLSQEKLGTALGLTFQQVQKYEKGTNRIGASRLQEIAKILGVPPGFFFEGAPTPVADLSQNSGFSEREHASSYVSDFISTVEGMQLTKAFVRIRKRAVRQRIVDLVTTLASAEAGDEDASSLGMNLHRNI
jgi:transcriptional regulator with XRE-family HTH domain